MAQIINIPDAAPSPTPVPNTQAPQDNGVAAVTNPTPGFAQQLAGAAAAAGKGAPGRYNNVTLPAFDPNAGPSPGAGAAATQDDPNASPLHKALSGLWDQTKQGFTYNTNLASGPSPVARITNFVAGNDATTKALNDQQSTAEFYQNPQVAKYMNTHREFMDAAVANPAGFAAALAPVVAMAGQALPTTANGKTMDDPTGVHTTAQNAGVHPDVAHPIVEPHQYSEDEFVGALRGKLTWGQMTKLWQQQHYLNPQQQVSGDYFSLLNNKANADEQAYQEAAQGGKAKGVLDALDQKRQKSAGDLASSMRAFSLGQGAYYGNQQDQ
jgi:hypothetical protein